MSSQRGRKKPTDEKQASLLEALKFIKPCQKKSGTIEQRFCLINNNWLVASDGVLTIGTLIKENLSACPQSIPFEEALKKAEGAVSITQLSEDSISVTSGLFRAVVPCVSFEKLQISAPDNPQVEIEESFKECLKNLIPLANENASEPLYSSILISGAIATATNGRVFVEYSHGQNLPPSVVLPKASANAVAKAKKKLVKFGYSGESCTFWFEDGSFIKSQLYKNVNCEYKELLNSNAPKIETPEEFFIAVKAVESFSKDGQIHLQNGKIASNELQDVASTYEIKGIDSSISFNASYLLMVKNIFKEVCFDEEQNKAVFFSENSRGVIMGIEKQAEDLAPF
jgi:hypothetical protein